MDDESGVTPGSKEAPDVRVEARLAAIEDRLDALTARLDSMLAPPPVVAPVRRASPAPPAIPSPIPDPIWHPVVDLREDRPVAPPVRETNGDIEYKIGVFGLIRGGAAVVVVGIVFLVALALAQGWITPRLQFVGEILLALGFLGYGWHRRADREEFGMLLMGVGSCGLYLSVAGGFAFKHLYAGKVVVGLFLLLSFANLAFGSWRRARSFWAIGMLGGFLASLMPLDQSRVGIALTLHFLVLIPAAIVAVRARWTDMAATLTLVGSAVLIPALAHDLPWALRVGALDSHALILAATLFQVPKTDRLDPRAWAVGGLGLAGIGALVIEHGPGGLLHVPMLALAIVGLGWIHAAGSSERRTLLGTALVLATTLTPFALRSVPAAFAFGGLALLFGALAFRLVPRERAPGGLVGLAWLHVALALGAFALSFGCPPATEAALLVLLSAAVFAVALGTRPLTRLLQKEGLNGAPESLAGLLIGTAFVRLIELARGGFGIGATGTQTVAFGTLLFAALAAGIAIRWRWTPAAFVAGTFGAIGVAARFGLAPDLAGPGSTTELAFGLAAMATVGVVGRAITGVTNERTLLTGAIVLPLWALLSRQAYVAVALASTLERGSWGITFTWIAFAAALLVVGFLRHGQRLRYWGFAVFGATLVKVFLADLAALNPAVRVAILLALGLTMIACGTWYLRGQATNPAPASPPDPGPTSRP